MRIIIAAGRSFDHRWPPSQRIPKQLVDVGGERLLDRTLRQFAPYGDIIVMHPPERRLPIEAEQRPAENDPKLGDINGLVNGRRHWSRTERTLVVLGDVWFTDAAVEAVVAPREEWALYGRPGWSKITGKKSDEQFAAGFGPVEHAHVIASATRGSQLVRAKAIRWTRFPQWFHLMHGVKGAKDIDRAPVVSLGNFVVIDDETDDIDKVEDYDRLKVRLRAS